MTSSDLCVTRDILLDLWQETFFHVQSWMTSRDPCVTRDNLCLVFWVVGHQRKIMTKVGCHRSCGYMSTRPDDRKKKEKKNWQCPWKDTKYVSQYLYVPKERTFWTLVTFPDFWQKSFISDFSLYLIQTHDVPNLVNIEKCLIFACVNFNDL